MKNKLLIIIAVFISVTALSAQQYSEIMILNNGSIIKGVVVEQIPNESYKIETADGSQFVYQWSDVSKIMKERVSSKPNNDISYRGEVLTGFGFGTGLLPMDRLYLHTVQGVKVGDFFSAGVGIGLNMIMPYAFDYNLPELYMPIYLNLKGYLLVDENVSIFGSFDIGGSFGLTEGVTGMSGLVLCPSVGVSINNKVNISLGYDIQKISLGNYFGSLNMNAVALKVSYIL